MTSPTTPVLQRSRGNWKVSAFLALAGLLVTFTPVIAWAASSSDDDVKPDGRLEGWPVNVVPDGGSSVTYMFFVVLALVTAGVCFMSSKRTHLD